MRSCIFLLFSLNITAQSISINSTGDTAHPSALLDLQSTNKGFLPPRMTTAQRNAIVSPAEGLLVYNRDIKCLEINIGSPSEPVWQCVYAPQISQTSGGTAVFSSITCSTSSAGTLTSGIPVSAVTQTITVNVTTAGTYAINALANGVLFMASGTVSSTGTQTITLTASGTPTNSGTSTFILNTTPSCSFSRTINLPSSCQAILTANPSASSGSYTIDPDGSGPLPNMSCQCDMVTDGGGWTLVLNYNHLGGTNPSLTTLTNRLPLINSTSLGVDESGNSTAWGHAGNSLLNSMSFTNIRFYAITSAHSRVIHFKTALPAGVAYVKSGTGSFTDLTSSYTTLASHSANLPLATDSYYTNQGNAALTEYPFFKGGFFHWGIRGVGSRWEVDNESINSSHHTYHQVWVR